MLSLANGNAITSNERDKTLSIAKMSKTLLNSSEYVLNEWLEGEIFGHEFIAVNPTRADNSLGSFKINLQSGVWSDFATSDSGGDFFCLYRYINDVDANTARTAIKAFIKSHGLNGKKKLPNCNKLNNIAKPKPPTEPISEENLKEFPPDSHPDKGPVSATWEYRNTNDEIVFYVARIDTDDGKETLPVRFIPKDNKWHWSYPSGKKPLFNCQYIEKDSQLIFSEGEKVATYLMQFDDYISVTSSGGSGRLFESDLSVINKGKSIVLFPDADEPGNKYAALLLAYCCVHQIPVSILNTDAMGWKDGEDAADFPELTWSDYESNLINLKYWLELDDDNAKLFDNAIFVVASQLDSVEYDRKCKSISQLLGIGKRTLDKQVKELRKPEYQDNEESEVDLEPTPEEIQQYRDNLYPNIAHIAESPDILMLVREALHQLGVVGEDNIINQTYLSTSSRLLKKPVSIIVKGSSSSGKSFTTQTTIRLFPETAFYILSGGSAKSLIYTSENFKHRMLVILEANQLNGASENDSYSMFLRTLISERKIRYETVEKNEDGELETRLIEKEGPTGLILTTTADAIHHENETRMLSAFSNESKDQTKAIISHIAQSYTQPEQEEEIEALIQTWHDFHDWISLGNHKVIIPFMPQIVNYIEHTPVRFRRDITQLGSLIQTSTIIHQATREISEEGYLIATIDDYALAKSVINAALSRESEATGSPRMMTVLQGIYAHLPDEVIEGKGSHKISSRALAKELGIPQSTISYQIKKLVEENYLKNMELLPGKPLRLKLGDEFNPELIKEKEILPSPESINKEV